jgi:hypothetical protein
VTRIQAIQPLVSGAQGDQGGVQVVLLGGVTLMA